MEYPGVWGKFLKLKQTKNHVLDLFAKTRVGEQNDVYKVR